MVLVFSLALIGAIILIINLFIMSWLTHSLSSERESSAFAQITDEMINLLWTFGFTLIYLVNFLSPLDISFIIVKERKLYEDELWNKMLVISILLLLLIGLVGFAMKRIFEYLSKPEEENLFNNINNQICADNRTDHYIVAADSVGSQTIEMS